MSDLADETIRLSELLGELGTIKRATTLPNGDPEPDSHHSFVLALTCLDFCSKHCPELDTDKIVRFALLHDLLEIITGDEDTLRYTPKQLDEKFEREQNAMAEFQELFKAYPLLLRNLEQYERLDTAEAATVFLMDKACTTWTHFPTNGKSLIDRGITTHKHADEWRKRQYDKFLRRIKVQPPDAVLELFESSFNKMKNELLEEI